MGRVGRLALSTVAVSLTTQRAVTTVRTETTALFDISVSHFESVNSHREFILYQNPRFFNL